jgi:hypothetical protein
MRHDHKVFADAQLLQRGAIQALVYVRLLAGSADCRLLPFQRANAV